VAVAQLLPLGKLSIHMHRFDEQFNDIDPATSRPFSGGHPDGVWVIAILYTVFALAGAGFGVIHTIGDLKAGVFPVLGLANLALAFGGYVPVVIFIFRRSAKAVVWMVGLLICVCIGSVTVLLSGTDFQGAYLATVIGVAVAVAFQGYITYYVYSLKQDSLLS